MRRGERNGRGISRPGDGYKEGKHGKLLERRERERERERGGGGEREREREREGGGGGATD